MEAFRQYSKYYNLLYLDKNYEDEVLYLDRLINRYRPDARNILDLGCGTGKHALLLAGRGYNVTGVDRSEEMISSAKDGLAISESGIGKRVSFTLGDIRDVRLKQRFDVAISMFHVISYQQTNDDLLRSFETASFHLKEKGLFIFDCWYGPGVLMDPPSARIKEIENESVSVKRVAQPVLHIHENLVDVHYHIFIKDKQTGGLEEVKEKHCMRYLFKPEVDLLCARSSFKLLAFVELLKDTPPADNAWNVCFAAQKA